MKTGTSDPSSRQKATVTMKKYRRFLKFRKIFGVIMVIPGFPLIYYIIRASFADDLLHMLLCLAATGLYCAFIAIAVTLLLKYDEKIRPKSLGNDPWIIHTGLFGRIWEETDAFPPREIAGGKVTALETCNNTIEIQVKRSKHEIDILIDANTLSIIADEESDAPAEFEWPLSSFADAQAVWTAITDFITQLP